MGYGLSYYDLKLISGLGLVLSEILGVLGKLLELFFFYFDGFRERESEQRRPFWTTFQHTCWVACRCVCLFCYYLSMNPSVECVYTKKNLCVCPFYSVTCWFGLALKTGPFRWWSLFYAIAVRSNRCWPSCPVERIRTVEPLQRSSPRGIAYPARLVAVWLWPYAGCWAVVGTEIVQGSFNLFFFFAWEGKVWINPRQTYIPI